MKYDITLLTSSKYLTAEKDDRFVKLILDEDILLTGALEKGGLKVTRTNWDNPSFNWAETKYVVFRTPWDYFSRYGEFSVWLDSAAKLTRFINPIETIRWNIDKHYMLDLQKAGINIPPTIFVEPGDKRSLAEIAQAAGWEEFILKPAVSGGAWHTYRLMGSNISGHEEIFKDLIKDKSMLLQEYQKSITEKGEISFMVFSGSFTHAVLKKAKQGDFRVQDNFGGTVHDYIPQTEEIKFAEHVVSACSQIPLYARVDVMLDNQNKLSLCELELFEPSLWFGKYPSAADLFSEGVINMIENS